MKNLCISLRITSVVRFTLVLLVHGCSGDGPGEAAHAELFDAQVADETTDVDSKTLVCDAIIPRVSLQCEAPLDCREASGACNAMGNVGFCGCDGKTHDANGYCHGIFAYQYFGGHPLAGALCDPKNPRIVGKYGWPDIHFDVSASGQIGSHNGETLRAFLDSGGSAADGTAIDGRATATVSAGIFSFVFKDSFYLMLDSEDLCVYADKNLNGSCDADELGTQLKILNPMDFRFDPIKINLGVIDLPNHPTCCFWSKF